MKRPAREGPLTGQLEWCIRCSFESSGLKLPPAQADKVKRRVFTDVSVTVAKVAPDKDGINTFGGDNSPSVFVHPSTFDRTLPDEDLDGIEFEE